MPAGKLTQPLKWPGGKNYLAKRIIAMMPPHLHYVEPYFGGGAVLLQRDPNRDWFIDEAWKLAHGEKVPAHLKGCSEVVNDINGDLSTFWQVLQDARLFSIFNQLCQVTPFSEAAYLRAKQILPQLRSATVSSDIVMRAWAFFVECRQSRSGMAKDFATLTRNRTRGRVNEQASAWWGCVDGLADVHARLKNVVILNQPALDVIRSQDDDNTLFYLDPPYEHGTRSTKDLYAHEMTAEQHQDLLLAIGNIKGKFLLSGYHCEQYDRAAEEFGWNCVNIEIDNKLAGGKKKAKEIECVWRNF
jgi:DNA adenine methylase